MTQNSSHEINDETNDNTISNNNNNNNITIK